MIHWIQLVLGQTLRRAQQFEATTMTELKQKYDASTVAVMRQALNEIVTDRRADQPAPDSR
jgi:hypothetical protein